MGSFGFSAPQRVCVVLEVPVLRPQVLDGLRVCGISCSLLLSLAQLYSWKGGLLTGRRLQSAILRQACLWLRTVSQLLACGDAWDSRSYRKYPLVPGAGGFEGCLSSMGVGNLARFCRWPSRCPAMFCVVYLVC